MRKNYGELEKEGEDKKKALDIRTIKANNIKGLWRCGESNSGLELPNKTKRVTIILIPTSFVPALFQENHSGFVSVTSKKLDGLYGNHIPSSTVLLTGSMGNPVLHKLR